jgi:hypothetical protein
MPGVYNDLRDFADRHRACGRAAGDAKSEIE